MGCSCICAALPRLSSHTEVRAGVERTQQETLQCPRDQVNIPMSNVALADQKQGVILFLLALKQM